MLSRSPEPVSRHEPVLLEEVLDFLKLSGGKKILDCTAGCGGHSRRILERIMPDGFLIGIDKDSQALTEAKKNLEGFEGKFVLFQDDFKNAKRIVESAGVSGIDGALIDLGVSSLQFDNIERGFSIKGNGPLDMRMDTRSDVSARDIINRSSFEELARIMEEFGEERMSKKIARLIVEKRNKKPLDTTGDLSRIVEQAYGYRGYRSHPATKVFQAFRIAVNNELESLKAALEDVTNILTPQSRLCIISFHSLEDRIVKNYFKSLYVKEEARLVVKKPVRPSRDEEIRNPRSRSAKLRVIEKI